MTIRGHVYPFTDVDTAGATLTPEMIADKARLTGCVVTNTPRAGETPEQTAARYAPRAKSVLGTQVGGDHYTRQKIQPITYIWANNLGFSEGNVVKYVTRWKYKGGVADLKKARHHLDLLIEEIETNGVQGNAR